MSKSKVTILFLCLLLHGIMPAFGAEQIHFTIISQTAVTFDWVGSESVIYYGTSNPPTNQVTAAGPSPSGSLPVSSPWTSNPGPFREAKLTGLTQNTLYYYKIGSGGAVHTFTTPLPRGTSGFTVCSTSDMQQNATTTMDQVMDMIAAVNPDFVIFPGDLTGANSSSRNPVWTDNRFNEVMVWSQESAFMPSWGNHDWDNAAQDDLRNYKGRFDFPNPQTSAGSPSVSCCGEDWYWFDYGNVRFITLPEPWNGNVYSNWKTSVDSIFSAAQNDSNINFIVCYGHRPAYSTGHHQADGTRSPAIELNSLGDKYSKFKLYINGHSHNYERSYPQHGVVHVTDCSGGAGLEQASGSCLWDGGCPKPSWCEYRAMHFGLLTLVFSQTSIQGTYYCGPAGGGTNDVTCTFDPAHPLAHVLDTFTISADGGGGGDSTPPTPNPLTWSSPPAATGSTTIAMTAMAATDETGPVQYFFQNTTSGMSSHNSGWQAGTSWTDTGLAANTTYSYHVQARDNVGPTPNVGSWSTTLSTTTQATADTTAPTPNPMTWSSTPAATGSTTIAMTATTASDATGPVQYFFQNTTSGMSSHNSGWQTGINWTDTGLTANTTYSYHVQARDSATPTPNIGGWSTTASSTTQPSGGVESLFSDNFDGDNTLLNGPWTRTSSSLDYIDMASYNSSPSSAKIKGASGGSWIQIMVDTSGYTNIRVKYTCKINTTDAFDSGEYLYSEWSTDGTNWTVLESTQGTSWASKDFSCGSGANDNSNFRVRFRVNANSGSEYAFVDDVEVTAGASSSDTTAPTPNPMTWSSAPAATGSTTITMTATAATDATVPVRYFFQNTTSGMSSHNSGWQNGASWTDTGLTPSTTYSYHVQARDSVTPTPNVGGWSITASATTQTAPDTAAPTPNPITWSSVPAATGSTAIAMTATTASDATGPVQYFFQNTTSGMSSHNSGWQTVASWTDIGLTANTQYTYQVQARDSVTPAPNIGGWSTTASATTQSGGGVDSLFSDNFDGDNTLLNGPWTRYSSSADYIDTAAYYSSPNSAKLKGSTESWIQIMVSTIGYTDIHVKYARKINSTDAFDSGEYLYAEWSTNGTVWNTLESTQSTSWALSDYACASGANNNSGFRVRFRVNASATQEYAFVDDVEVTGTGSGDSTTPTPNPMTFFWAPAATGSTTIMMTATTASDASSVEYFFHNVTVAGHDSGWQTGTSWVDTGLAAGTIYSYQVKARDQSSNHNETGYSTTASATTSEASQPVTLFSDGFETNTLADANVWSRTSSALDYRTSSSFYSGAYSAKIKGAAGGSYIEKAVSTVGYKDITIQYAHQIDAADPLDSGEYLYVEWSIDGTNWNVLESTQDTVWADMESVCGSGADNNSGFRVRWRVNANASSEVAYVDDISVVGIPQ